MLAIYILQGEEIPCMWSHHEYFWRDFEKEVKYLNDDFNFLMLLKKKGEPGNRHFIFSVKHGLLVDGFNENADLDHVLEDLRTFKKNPKRYGLW
jgi:hypothetical protein